VVFFLSLSIPVEQLDLLFMIPLPVRCRLLSVAVRQQVLKQSLLAATAAALVIAEKLISRARRKFLLRKSFNPTAGY
jgi:hypothetical protein